MIADRRVAVPRAGFLLPPWGTPQKQIRRISSVTFVSRAPPKALSTRATRSWSEFPQFPRFRLPCAFSDYAHRFLIKEKRERFKLARGKLAQSFGNLRKSDGDIYCLFSYGCCHSEIMDDYSPQVKMKRKSLIPNSCELEIWSFNHLLRIFYFWCCAISLVIFQA